MCVCKRGRVKPGVVRWRNLEGRCLCRPIHAPHTTVATATFATPASLARPLPCVHHANAGVLSEASAGERHGGCCRAPPLPAAH